MKFLITILLFISLHTGATTWYIDPSGNDATGTGAAGSPWKTLYKATNTVTTSGDIIHINAGTYIETLQCVLAPGVSIEGDGRTVTTIKSTITNDFIEMLNCRSAMGTNGNQHITGLKFDGQNTTWALIRIGGRSNFEIHDCDFVDAKIHGVTFAARNTDDNDPGFPATYCTGNKFYDNTMTNCGGWEVPNTGGNGFGNLQFGGQKGFLCYGNTIVQDRAPYNNGWPIKYWQGGYNIGCKIYNNYLQHRKQDFTLGDNNWDFAIEMFNVAGLEVYDNTIVNGAIDINGTTTTGYNTGVGSFWSAGYGYVLHAHDNNFYMSSTNTHVQTGITLEFNIDTVIIENNTFDKFNIGVLFTPRTGNTVSHVTIRNNLFTGMAEGEGTEGYGIDMGVYSGSNINYNGVDIYNNTFINNTSSPTKFGICLPNSTGSGSLKNINIKNNIFRGFYEYPFRVREGTVAIDSLDIQYNSLTNNGNSNTPAYTVTPTHYTFSNNNNTAPAFGTGYKLLTSNALVDAGVNVGLPYLGAAPDINWTDSTEVYSPPPAPCNSFDTTIASGSVAFSNSNRTITKTGFSNVTAFTSQSVNSGKVFWYVDIDSIGSIAEPYNWFIGIANQAQSGSAIPTGDSAYSIRSDGQWFHSSFYSGTSSGGAWNWGYHSTMRIGFALDNTGHTLRAYQWTGTTYEEKDNYATSIPAGNWFPVVSGNGRPFTYTINLSPTVFPTGLEAAGYTAYCTGAPAGDVTPPTITGTTPAGGATGVALNQTVAIDFDEALDGATVTTGNFYITGVTSAVSMTGNTVYINPASDLSYSTTYTVHVTTGVTDAAGNALATPLTFTFTTTAAPVPPVITGRSRRTLYGIRVIKN